MRRGIFVRGLIAASLLLSAVSALAHDARPAYLELVAAPVGKWHGPIESAYGLPLVRVLARTEPRLPDFDDLRDRLSNDYSFETRRAANALALERLTERYQIVFEGSWTLPSVELARSTTPLRGGTQ